MLRTEIESHIDTVDLGWFLSLLPDFAQPEVKLETPVLASKLHQCSWVLQNLDFIDWDNDSSSRILWLSPPPECDLRLVVSSILQREIDRNPKKQKRIFYYFCSPDATESSPSPSFIGTLAYQIILSAPATKQASIVQKFLQGILSHMFKTQGEQPDLLLQWFSRCSGNCIRGLLEAPEESLWAALWGILPTEQNQSLLMFIIGLEYGRDHFVHKIFKVIEALHQQNKAKVLLTGRLMPGSWRIRHRLIRIDYDVERKGLAIYRSSSKHQFALIRHRMPFQSQFY